MSTTPTTSEQGQAALALARLTLCGRELTAAHQDAVAAAVGLSGARHSRADELAVLIGDALAFTRRLSTVVEADLRAQDEPAATATPMGSRQFSAGSKP